MHATADEGIGSEIGSEEVQKLKEPSEAGSLGSAPTETPVARIVKASPTGLFALVIGFPFFPDGLWWTLALGHFQEV